MDGMKQIRLTPVFSLTIDKDVMDKADSIAASLGMTRSAFVNLQLRLTLNMLDEDAKELLSRGLPKR